MATAVGTRGERGRGAELLAVNPKLALTPVNENTEWEEGGEERPTSTACEGWTDAGEEDGRGTGSAGAGGGGKNVHKIACAMLTVGSRRGLKSWGFRCWRSAKLEGFPTSSF